MVSASTIHDPKLVRQLVLDELFDLSLYAEVLRFQTQRIKFLQDDQTLPHNAGLPGLRLYRHPSGLEAIEVHGVRKYLALWSEYQSKPIGEALRGILMDEFKHEDVLVTELTKRKINPERIRNIFLGLNDGLVEILGAVSGFFGAFGSASMVLMAASTTAGA